MTAFLRHKVVWIHAYQIWWLLIVSYFSLFCQRKIKIQKHHMIKHTTKSINESRNLIYHFQHTTFSIIKTWQNANNCLCFAHSSTPKKEKKKLKHWACCVDQHQHWEGVGEKKAFLAKRENIPRLLTVTSDCVREQHLLSPSGELSNCVLVQFVLHYLSTLRLAILCFLILSGSWDPKETSGINLLIAGRPRQSLLLVVIK